MIDDSVSIALHHWLQYDHDPASVDTVKGMDRDKLREIMTPRISFGTSGLRAEMGPGFARMNPVTVQIAAKCLAEYCKEHGQHSIVIGYDCRHNSLAFARISYGQFKKCGLTPILLDDHCPTPLLAFAVTHFQAHYGVMVTASHNPRQDNGYKVYSAKGCQIVAPDDKAIAQKINDFDDVSLDDLSGVDIALTAIDKVLSAYSQAMLATLHPYLPPAAPPEGVPGKRIVYTPVHGVGRKSVEFVFNQISRQPLLQVPSQQDPDPDFPTVKFPNPEEGASVLKLAIQTADRHHAGLVFANDPDVDRDGQWRIFTGNEIAVLLAEYVLSKNDVGPDDYLLSTVVSSRFIERQAAMHNCRHECTLTGFKHIGNLAWALEHHEQRKRVLFAFEESIGFMVGTTVLEKDGISALVLTFCLVSTLHCSLAEHLDQIYSRYGCRAVQYNSYYFCPVDRTAAVFDVIRQRVKDVQDAVLVKDYSPSNMLTLRIGDDLTLTLRASGTEPKVKFYAESTGELRDRVDKVLHHLLGGLELHAKED